MKQKHTRKTYVFCNNFTWTDMDGNKVHEVLVIRYILESIVENNLNQARTPLMPIKFLLTSKQTGMHLVLYKMSSEYEVST